MSEIQQIFLSIFPILHRSDYHFGQSDYDFKLFNSDSILSDQDLNSEPFVHEATNLLVRQTIERILTYESTI